MTDRLVIDKAARFTRRRWNLALGSIAFGAAVAIGTLRRGFGLEGLQLAGLFAIPGLLLLGWMVYTKIRKKRVLVLDGRSVELRAVDDSGWLIARTEVERLVLRRVKQANDRRELPMYGYELRLRLRPDAKLGKQNGIVATKRGPVQTTPDRFTEAEAWRIQEFARDRLGIPVTASRVAPTVRGQVATSIPAPPTGKTGHRRPIAVYPAGVRALFRTVYATRQPSRMYRVFSSVLGWISFVTLLVQFSVVELAEHTELFLGVLALLIGSVVAYCLVAQLDFRDEARQRRATELVISEHGLRWRFHKPAQYQEHPLPYRLELRWPEVRSIQVTNQIWRGRTVRTVEIVPGDDEFAKRHPEMGHLWETGLELGPAVPPSTGSYRLQTDFVSAAVRQLTAAIEAHQPGVLHLATEHVPTESAHHNEFSGNHFRTYESEW